MGSIPLPALAVKGPEPFDPTEEQLKLEQLHAAQTNNQLGRVQLQEATETQQGQHRAMSEIARGLSPEQTAKNMLLNGVPISQVKAYIDFNHQQDELAKQRTADQQSAVTNYHSELHGELQKVLDKK